MPFLDAPISLDTPMGQAKSEPNLRLTDEVDADFGFQPQSVGFFESARAGFQLGNPVTEALRAADYLRLDNTVEEGYDPFKHAEEMGVPELAENLTWANNRKYGDAIISHALRERDFRRTRDASGLGGFLGELVGGLASPTNFIPGLGLVRAIKGGYSVGRSALGIGVSAGGAVAIDEGVLQAAQAERTAGETALNIGGGVLLGGLIGGTAASLLGKVERELFEKGWRDLDSATGQSAGAEAVRKWSYDDLSVSGWAARGIVNSLDFINPNIRLATSASLVAREIGQQLGENTLYFKLNDSGASAAAAGSAETEAFRLLRSTLNIGFGEMEGQYKAMKQAGLNMSWHDFDQAVGKAMRRNDTGENDFISNAAKALRANITDEFRDRAVKEGLLPPDISVSEAPSYFSRLYNTERIVATDGLSDGFKARIMPWVQERMEKAYLEHQGKTTAKIAQLKTDVEDLKLDKVGRVGLLSDIDAKMSELATTYRDGFDADQEIKRLNREAAKAKKEGDPAKETSLRDQAKSLKDNAAAYREVVAPVLRRRRVVERGIGANASKIDKIQDQLVKLEEGNLTSLRRLVAKGQWLQKELGKLPTEEKLKEQIAALVETFNQVGKQFDDGLDRVAQINQKIDDETKALKEKQGSQEGKEPLERAQAFNEYTKALAPMQQRVVAFENAQAARRAKLDRLAQRMEEAEALDVTEVQLALREMVDELVQDISSMSLGRGERAARLLERMDKLDPKNIEAHIAKAEALAKKLDEDFRQRWEVKMLGDGVDLNSASKPDFNIAARDTVQEIFDMVTGKHNLMNSNEMAEWRISPKRGPLKDRTFHIPDEVIEDFLHSSARQVQEVMARRMAGQVVLQKKFGSTTLEPQIKAIKEDYDQLKARVAASGSYQEALLTIGKHYGFKEKMAESFKGFEKTQQGLQRWLDDELKADVRDIQGLRDLISGRYKPDAHSSGWGRTMRAANQVSYMRLSGRFLIASLADMYRVPMINGLASSLGALPKMLSQSLTADGVKVSAAALKELKLAGLVSEKILHTKMASVAELGDPFTHGTRAERFLENGSKFATKWNGMAHFQDFLENWGGIMSQNRIIDAVKQGKDDRWLSYLGLEKINGTARRVRDELVNHAEKVDGVWLANTEKWTSQDAVDAFRNALSKEVTRTVIRPSQGDVPLAAKTPLGGAIFQFRTFMLAAHQRIMLTGMQEGPARFMSGLIGLTTIGMFVSYLKSLSGGNDAHQRWQTSVAANPLFLLGEGVDNGAMFPIFFELSNSVEKATKSAGFSFNPIKSPLKALYDGKLEIDSQKNWNIPLEQSLVGPSFGTLTAGARAAGAGADLLQGEELSKGRVRQAAPAIPFATHLGFKEMIQLLNDDLPYMR